MKKVLLVFVMASTLFVGCKKDELPPQNEKEKVEVNVEEKTKNPVKKVTYETVVLQREQNFWLNSATHLGFSKKTRTSVPITLPDNTVAFYYIVAVTESKTPISNIKLGVQLASLLVDQTGTLGSIASKVELPAAQSSGRVDVYLLDTENNDKFLAKEDFSYYRTGTRESLSKGIIDVADFTTTSVEDWVKNPYLTRNFYIGIRNPRSTTGENISIEAVAVVKKETTVYE